MEDERSKLLQSLMDVVERISAVTEFKCPVKKQFCNLARRIKLLIPMFEEIRENKDQLSEEIFKSFVALKEILDSTQEMLRFGAEGSKIYMVLEREQVVKNYCDLTGRMEQTLSEIPLESLDISDEVKEQAELVLTQFRRAKGRFDTTDDELHSVLYSLYENSANNTANSSLMRMVSEKLQLTGIADLTQESIALHDMVSSTGGDPEGRFEKMSQLLTSIKIFVQTENPNLEAPPRDSALEVNVSEIKQSTDEGNRKIPVIPEDFRCPISLELMKDPVIVSTGQTYERVCIERWLETGHSTCPKTQQALNSTALTPNYVLRSLISQWCEINGVESPKRQSTRSNSAASPSSPTERIEILLHKLTSGVPEDQLSAAGEIRLLAKRNADNRIAIAEAGVIPHLVHLLSNPDLKTQEHAVTALLNLSICEDNKSSIISAGAVPGIVQVLRKGSMEARENAAATLFSLSVVDENKVTIGALGAIPPLVDLLNEGSPRGKKDAATALFNLCIWHGNKGKAVRAGVVKTVMHLLTERGGGMVDEALAILAILASHSEGRAAIGAEGAVPILVEVIGSGSPRNRENAAAVLVHLCAGDQSHMTEAHELGVIEYLNDLAENGTDRGKRKAHQLLERFSRFLEQQKMDSSLADAFCHSSRI